MARPRLVGINHVALEVGDIDEALAFYGSIFDLVLRGRSAQMAFTSAFSVSMIAATLPAITSAKAGPAPR